MDVLLNSYEIVDSLFKFIKPFYYDNLSYTNKRLRELTIEYFQKLTQWDKNIIRLKTTKGVDRVPFFVDSCTNFLPIIHFGVKVSIKFFTNITKQVYLIVRSLEYPKLQKVFHLNSVSTNSTNFVLKFPEKWHLVTIPPNFCTNNKSLLFLVCSNDGNLIIVDLTNIGTPSFHLLSNSNVPFSTSLFNYAKKHFGISDKTCNARLFHIALFWYTMRSLNGKEFFVLVDSDNMVSCNKRFPIWEIYISNDLSPGYMLSALNDYVISLSNGVVKTFKLPQQKVIIDPRYFEFNQLIDPNLDKYMILDDSRFIVFDSHSKHDQFHIVDVKLKQNLIYKTDYEYDSICWVDNSKIKIKNYQTGEYYLLDFS